MTKPGKSQWDFGELFPVEATRQVLTVGELTSQVKRLLEKQIGQIWVSGEISNFRAQSSGHCYFTLKDADSQLNCVLFRGEAPEARAFLQDGRKVILQGGLTVYEPRGQYQLRVMTVELAGMGALQIAFEKLKQKLNAEGLFETARKRPLPRYPQRIGIVTSPTGAAIRDVLHVVKRRHSRLEIIVAPCRVQGQGAAAEIAAAINLLNNFNSNNSDLSSKLDLILVTRGGGSLEDLWAFNEEPVARAIFESNLPVVSAVGHEIDFTISDFVADLRAATPSAAAEIITEGVFSSVQFVAEAGRRLRQLADANIETKKLETQQIVFRLARMNPRRRINESLQRLDDLRETLSRTVRRTARERRMAWAGLRDRLLRLRPRQILDLQRERLKQNHDYFVALALRQLKTKREQLRSLETRLRLLGPEQVLSRGYSITMSDDTGKIIRSAGEVKPGQKLRTRLKTGEINSEVKKTS